MTEEVWKIPHFYSDWCNRKIRILTMETQSQDFRLTWVNYSQKLTESFHKFLTSEILCNVTLWVHNGTSSSNDGIGGGPTGSNSIKVCKIKQSLFPIRILEVTPMALAKNYIICLIFDFRHIKPSFRLVRHGLRKFSRKVNIPILL